MSMLLLVLGALASAFAQDCPRIIVSGGDGEGVPAPGEPIPYVVSIDPPERAVGLSYLWTVHTRYGPVGMVRGQGTARIEVPYTHNGATATVKVIGLPAGCSNEASDMVSIDPPPQPIRIDEIAGPVSNAPKSVFTNIKERFANYPGASLAVSIAEGKRGASYELKKRAVAAKLRLNRNESQSRIIFVRSAAKDDKVIFWLVPAGAALPN
jgi:hypothetical protein